MAFRRGYRTRRSMGMTRRRAFRMTTRSAYRRRGGARGIAGMSMPFIGGAALGMYAPRLHPMQDTLINLAAIVPIRLPYGIQNIAKGYTVAVIAKGLLGMNGGNGGNGGFA